MTRLITERQEQIYRMRHHDFGSMTTKQVAMKLGVTTHTIARHMWEMQKIAPQLFPILTKRQADVYHMFVNVGLELKIIAGILGISKSNAAKVIHRMKHKNMYVPRKRRHVLYMPRAHDHQIRQKF